MEVCLGVEVDGEKKRKLEKFLLIFVTKVKEKKMSSSLDLFPSLLFFFSTKTLPDTE